MIRPRRFWILAFAPAFGFAPGAAAAGFDDARAAAFVENYCANCHNDVDQEAGLDLTSLKFNPADAAAFQTWVKVNDKLAAGEMPPKNRKKRPPPTEVEAFVRELSTSLTAAEQEAIARDGRTLDRRLNRYEYENAVRDLLRAPWLQIKDQ